MHDDSSVCLESRCLAAPVFSDASLPSPPNPVFSPVTRAVSGRNIATGQGTTNTFSEAAETWYPGDEYTIPYVTVQESGTVINAVDGPQPGDPSPGTLQEFSIVASHQHNDTVTTYGYEVPNQTIYGGPGAQYTQAGFNTPRSLKIENSNDPSASLIGSTLSIDVTLSLTARSTGFYRVVTLGFVCPYMSVYVNSGSGGLIATNTTTGATLAQDPTFGGAAADSAIIHLDVPLPDVHSVDFTADYYSTLYTGFFDSPERIVVGPQTTVTQFSSFDVGIHCILH